MKSSAIALSVLAFLLTISVVHASPYVSINIVNNISQTNASVSVSHVSYTFTLYNTNGPVFITLPSPVYAIHLFQNGSVTSFSAVNESSGCLLYSLPSINCTRISFNAVNQNETFVLAYAYKTYYSPNQRYFNSTFDFIPLSGLTTSPLTVTSVLPTGATLLANSHPVPNIVTLSYGRNTINATWSIASQTGGQIELPFTIGYTKTFYPSVQTGGSQPPPQDYFYLIYVGIIVAVVAIALFVLYKHLWRRTKTVHASSKKPNPFVKLLNEHERRVLNMFKRDGYTVQNDIISATGFSKAKVSKIISKLANYKLIKVKPDGKFNKIKRK